jgi:hypothetical protein
VYIDDPSTYLKLVAHLVPKEMLAYIEVSHSVALRAEVELFSAGFDKLKQIVGADVEDAIIEG